MQYFLAAVQQIYMDEAKGTANATNEIDDYKDDEKIGKVRCDTFFRGTCDSMVINGQRYSEHSLGDAGQIEHEVPQPYSLYASNCYVAQSEASY